MRQHDRIRNRQAQTEARCFIHVARAVAAHEGLQHIVLAA
jgi:hypothetical protein